MESNQFDLRNFMSKNKVTRNSRELILEEKDATDEMDLDDRLEGIHYEWEKWRENTSPDPRDITTAKRDVIQYIVNYLKRSLK